MQRSASLKIDWTRLTSQLGLKGTTATSLAAFKKRNDDARRKVAMLSEQPQSVDFEHYRSILNNKAVVDEIERQVKPYKPATYDVGRQLKAIEAFEATAVKSAQDTKAVVDQELHDLNKTLRNIEEARPIEQLTTVRFFFGFFWYNCSFLCYFVALSCAFFFLSCCWVLDAFGVLNS